MPTSTLEPTPTPTPATDRHAEEPATPAAPIRSADDAPAPFRPELERAVLVRDAYGRDPYGGDHYGPDGERVDAVLGLAPDQLPDPIASALRATAAAADPPEPDRA